MNPAAQSQALLIGRLLLAAIFLVAGLRKLMPIVWGAGGAATAGYFAKLGFPMPEVMVWVAIVIEIGGALLLIAGWHARPTAWLLILFVAIATAMAHRFWEFDAAQYNNQLNHFLKNVAIIGGLLYVAAMGPGSASVDAKGARP
jgi:putative oxidoreductase